jgi:hypothetical protein
MSTHAIVLLDSFASAIEVTNFYDVNMTHRHHVLYPPDTRKFAFESARCNLVTFAAGRQRLWFKSIACLFDSIDTMYCIRQIHENSRLNPPDEISSPLPGVANGHGSNRLLVYSTASTPGIVSARYTKIRV